MKIREYNREHGIKEDMLKKYHNINLFGKKLKKLVAERRNDKNLHVKFDDNNTNHSIFKKKPSVENLSINTTTIITSHNNQNMHVSNYANVLNTTENNKTLITGNAT